MDVLVKKRRMKRRVRVVSRLRVVVVLSWKMGILTPMTLTAKTIMPFRQEQSQAQEIQEEQDEVVLSLPPAFVTLKPREDILDPQDLHLL